MPLNQADERRVNITPGLQNTGRGEPYIFHTISGATIAVLGRNANGS
jgi:hypothetical protein